MTDNITSSVAWVLSRVEKIKIKLVCIVSLSLLVATIVIGEVYMIQCIIDSVMEKSYNMTSILAVGLVFILIANTLMSSVQDYAGHKLLRIPIVNSLTKEFLKNIYKIPFNILNEKNNAVYIDVLTKNIQEIASGINQKAKSISYVIQMLILFFIIGNISIYILLVTVLLGILFLYIGRVFTEKMVNARKEYMEEVSLIHKVTEESISSSREVLAYNRCEWEEQRRLNVFKKYYIKAKRSYTVHNLQYITTSSVKWIMTLFCLFYGGYLVLNDRLSIALFVAIYKYSELFLKTAEIVYTEATDLSDIVAKVMRIKSILYTEDDKADMKLNRVESIEFENVSYRYNDLSDEVISNINFKVDRKNIIAIVGPSGSGKSTIIKLLLSIIKPTKGIIKINGINLNNIKSDEWLGKNVAACFQDSFLFPDTIENNILLGHKKSNEEVLRICEKVYINDYINRQSDGIMAEIGDRGINLSGGERQRIALARLFTKNVDVFMLDESTSAIDIQTEKLVQQNLNEFIMQYDKMMFVVAHRLSTIRDADHIIVMKDGQIYETGNHESLVNADSLYKKLITKEEVLVQV